MSNDEFDIFDVIDDTPIKVGDKKYKIEDDLFGPTSVLTKIDESRLLKDTKSNTVITSRDRNLKILLLQYIRKYKKNPRQYYEHPKQIKNLPSWFEHALALFQENEIPKDGVREYFKSLIAYRDSRIGSPDDDEMDMLNEQYGEASPYNDDYDSDFKFDGQDAIEQVDLNQHARDIADYQGIPQGQQIEQTVMSTEQQQIMPQQIMPQQMMPQQMMPQQMMPQQTIPQQSRRNVAGYLYGGRGATSKQTAGNLSSNVKGLDNIILNRSKSEPEMVAGPTMQRTAKKSKQRGDRKTTKKATQSPFKIRRTQQKIQVRNTGSDKVTSDIAQRIKAVKERSGMIKFDKIGKSGISIGHDLVGLGRKTSKRTVEVQEAKKFVGKFGIDTKSLKIDKSKLGFREKIDLKGDNVGEVKMLKNIIKTPSFMNTRKDMKEIMKSDKYRLTPPKITKLQYDFSFMKKKNKKSNKQDYDETDYIDFEN